MIKRTTSLLESAVQDTCHSVRLEKACFLLIFIMIEASAFLWLKYCQFLQTFRAIARENDYNISVGKNNGQIIS